ncbi:hypothetical protein B0T16DRAFT_395716 [Cercophora newfieldiana]|uniref:Ecp2 effector protein-like domain-containing protein n=1 Tax=Cercophora newfieldiana TaxID=92897 RepID=A0AA40CX50_9PEZI|nr:hypothetical protein B0T16DRAFT_395716 [Cercophora newfieldiana]
MVERQTVNYYTAEFDQYHRTGTCAFGVVLATFNYPGEGIPMWWANIGSDDVWDLVQDSVKRYQWTDKVGAKGVVKCEDALIGWAWAIYRSWGGWVMGCWVLRTFWGVGSGNLKVVERNPSLHRRLT